ncbi:MAG TPA: pyruvate kinase [Tissierellia bacterium]|nr:pyruvate kinase [Tissierellia bacterium]
MRKTKIVCTLGPASEDKDTIREMILAGMDVARLNFSHGTHDDHLAKIQIIKELRKELGLPVAILLDTKGPEIRLGKVEPGCFVHEGDSFVLTPQPTMGCKGKVTITYAGLHNDIQVGDRILIDDGLITLLVTSIDGEEIHTLVEHGGEVKSQKGVNIPGARISLPALTEQDLIDLKFGVAQEVDFIAASFIRTAQDVLDIRKVLEEFGDPQVQIISKIENRQGYENLESILQVSDGIMVARGDLGVEMPIEEIPVAQKIMIRESNQAAKPVITATQMLESMVRNPTPTRAEATDVANAIYDGTDAVMLSAESAAGKYPVESVRMLASIAHATEETLKKNVPLKFPPQSHDSVTYAVSEATVETAHKLEAVAIITPTTSGFTARKVAMFRPNCPIYAATTRERVRRRLNLVRGVLPVMMNDVIGTDALYKELVRAGTDGGFLSPGDLVVLTAGIPIGVSGTTNLMKVHVVGEVLLKGKGIGHQRVKGRLRRANEPLEEGDILLLEKASEEILDGLERCGALITRAGRFPARAVQRAISREIPVLIDVGFTEELLSGEMFEVDAKLGLVFSASTSFPQE